MCYTNSELSVHPWLFCESANQSEFKNVAIYLLNGNQTVIQGLGIFDNVAEHMTSLVLSLSKVGPFRIWNEIPQPDSISTG